ncbi:hypothetical protein DFJ63DRAFT_335024 [Scheffersomyces coipomensis]|uniref:uncharacterized protein n=1 Tax=Scheffersomyces coipomensis TaxID=1788519 RepID=UPI00315DE4A5
MSTETLVKLNQSQSVINSSEGVVSQFWSKLQAYLKQKTDDEAVAKFYDTIESDGRLHVSNTKNIPMKRGITCLRGISAHGVLVEFLPISRVYKFESSDQSNYIEKNQDKNLKQSIINQSLLSHNFESLILAIFKLKYPDSKLPVDEFFILLIRVLSNCLISESYRFQVHNLTSHNSEIRAQKESNHLLDSCEELALTILSIIPVNDRITIIFVKLKEDLFNLASICAVNFNVLNNRLQEPIGISFDPTFSLINHSCKPNTVLIACDDDKTLQLITTRVLTKGVELKTNYCFTNFPQEIRKLDLKRRFFFDCKCNLCSKIIDYFFAYICPKCETIIHTMNMSNCFDAILPDLLPITCQSCQHEINIEKFKECELWHKLLLAMIITCDDDDVEIENIEQLKEIMIPLLETLRDKPITTEGLTALYLDKAHFYTMNSKRAVLFKQIIDKLVSYNIIPGYCFPLNLYIDSFDVSHFMPESESKTIGFRCLHLKFELRKKFLASIPSDISGQMKVCNSLYVDIGHAIMNVLVALYYDGEPSNVPDLLSDWLNGIDLINTLIRCALCFYLQAIDSYLKYSKKTVEELTNAIYQLKTINNLASNPLVWKTKSFSDETFSCSLKQLFQYGEVDHKIYFHKGNDQVKIKINLANGSRIDLFKNVKDLKSKSLQEIQ